MDMTFITIHDLSEDAHILYSSDSIVDILGHTPDEVKDRSVWDFFHPDEVPFAKKLHNRGVMLDKAAVLSYCRIKNRQGDWVGCESCFSIVYNVMVCCTSIYRHGMESQKRATDAPLVRKLFSSSPKDPRYHMLSHLSSKFTLPPEEQTHEPRAALFINRYTRTLTVMHVTSGIEEITGIPSDRVIGKSFYSMIAENCLRDAVSCLESAKGNDSIAYLRFMLRDPRQDDPPELSASESEDDFMTDASVSEDESQISEDTNRPSLPNASSNSHHSSMDTNGEGTPPILNNGPNAPSNGSRGQRSSTSQSQSQHALRSPFSEGPTYEEPIELEAVVSCTSDGLVVCLRRARPMLPNAQLPSLQASNYQGMFAAPWAAQPMFQPALPQLPPYPLGAQHPAMAQAPPAPAQNAFMQSIRDVAVFAWALVGINGSLADYTVGKPVGESQPPTGFPVWDPVDGGQKLSLPRAPSSGYVSGSGSSSGNSNDPWGFGDPGLN
ncbi:unnamed protein product [Periconia digitata]|uniref:PAS domain-containing protein n=1 Tax=Periconia digitata TaxID=1303443 RepID=A0A9W4UJ56_9PLEO|nr:unnamed protein product [Periconia digitata]